jgi:hypothetical protein
MEKDNINPKYYKGKVEVIEAIEAWNLNFHRGNAIKYISRAGKKNPEKEIEDLKKACWYINREIDRLTGKERKQVYIALEKSLTSRNFYLTINDTFYLELIEDTFYELAEFVGINVKEQNNDR